MNPLTMLLGALAFAFGLYTLYARNRKPENFRKLTAMKERWGERTGNTVHLLAYSILPIVAGMIFVIAGWLGFQLF